MHQDPAPGRSVLRFLAERGKTARFVTSVCTGALVLGAAGLLEGYKATTHWATYEALAALGATVEHRRVVTDRNRVTGGGVTAGIDFGLTLLAELRGEVVAKTTQLVLEYDPAPPFDAGTPAAAGPELTAMVLKGPAEAFFARSVAIAKSRREGTGAG